MGEPVEKKKSYWLMKSEPDHFSIDDLRERGEEPWDGVRNYQARNLIRDRMKPGDGVLFYHSNCEIPGVVGVAEVSSPPYPDPTAFEPDSDYYDPKSDPAAPRWWLVDVRFVRKLHRTISLAELKGRREMAESPLVQRGNRLSVLPMTEEQWRFVLSLEQGHC